jgi:hypothetical protein
LSVVDLPESFIGISVNENGASRTLSQPIRLIRKLSGRFGGKSLAKCAKISLERHYLDNVTLT